jgi:hypothetical protein
MIHVVYSPEEGTDKAIPDGHIEDAYEEFLALLCADRLDLESDRIVVVSTFLFVERLRLGIMRGEVGLDEVHLGFQPHEGDEIQDVVLDIHARPTKWPEGFGDHHVNLLSALIEEEHLGRS